MNTVERIHVLRSAEESVSALAELTYDPAELDDLIAVLKGLKIIIDELEEEMKEDIEDDGFVTVVPNLKKEYDKRHGGPYDRGGADSYYGRPANPHYYVGKTGMSDRVEKPAMSVEEIEAYEAGYLDNELHGDKKDYR